WQASLPPLLVLHFFLSLQSQLAPPRLYMVNLCLRSNLSSTYESELALLFMFCFCSGLPSMIRRSSGVKCSMETNQPKKEKNSTPVFSAVGVMLSAVMSSSSAMALVDERMSTEGTGLPFGLSNNLLGWILLGVFGLIWAVYFNYVSSLDEDDDSGLSL
ncbi:unnamed protein product, partial [Brassica oleracea var. botrytis]